MFKQYIEGGRQVERPDYWLGNGCPFEIPRPDVTYPVRFYGSCTEGVDESGRFNEGRHEAIKLGRLCCTPENLNNVQTRCMVVTKTSGDVHGMLVKPVILLDLKVCLSNFDVRNEPQP